ncbi:MAG: thioredoxin family protein [Flavobacteriales bacterium]|nr:thioredoxin family protein [Flavobacteriales bacterium]
MKHIVLALLFFVCVGHAQTIDQKRSSISNRVEKAPEKVETQEENGVFLKGEYKNILEQASKEEKAVLLHFGAEWCLPCKQMKRMTYPNSIVKGKLEEGYLAFEVDVDYFWGMDIAEEYGVSKYPTVVILNSNGKVREKHEGYLGPREMYRLLRNY